MAANGNDWSRIQNPERFEGLMRALLGFEYPDAHLFGRAGRDAGQDMRSKDGTIVYQFKFHGNYNTTDPAGVIKKIVKEELKQIRKYRKEGDGNYKKWKDVTHWELWTNLTLNPEDVEKLNEEFATDLNDVEKLNGEFSTNFNDLKIEPVWHYRSYIDKLLLKYPDIQGAFFEGKERCFLNSLEQSEWMKRQLPTPKENGGKGGIPNFVGREAEIGEILNFILHKGERILILYGGGGLARPVSAWGPQKIWSRMTRSGKFFGDK